jgi:subtilisin family serine protease
MERRKLDPRLGARHRAYRQAVEAEGDSAHEGYAYVSVAVIFEGDPARLGEAGLLVRSVYGPVAYGDVRVSDLERLADLPEVKQIQRESEAHKLLDDSVPEIHAPPVWNGSPSFKGTGVIVGVVDTGIDIFHNCFRKPDDGASRILSIWDQLLPTSGPPSGFTYGQEFDDDAIKDALEHSDQPFAHQDVDGHGTHVAGTAAGDGTQSGNCHLSDHFIGVAPDADLVIVKSEFGGSTYVDGVKYVFDVADAQTPPKAAVVNLSLGGGGAPHDGTSADELALDALLAARPAGNVVVAAAGNSAADGFHAHRRVAAGGSATMTFHVHPNDRFRLFVAVWYGGIGIPASGPDVAARLKLTLQAPDGATVDVLPSNDPPSAPFAGGTVDLFSETDVGRPGRHQITFTLFPPSQRALLAGDWIIKLEETSGAAGTDVDCWLDPFHTFRVTEPIAASATVTIQFNVPEKLAGTSSIRLTYSGAARLTIKVTTPDPDSTEEVAAGAGAVEKKCGKHTARFNSEVDTPGPGSHRIVFFIDAPIGKEVDKGLWTVTLTETAGHATTVHGRFPEERPYIRIGGIFFGRTEKNEPRFIAADRVPARTVESPATAQNVIAVGAYDPNNGALADFSSRGPTVDGRHKPDLAAPGVAITAPKTRARGKSLCCDCCVDFYTDLQGTSMAAPHVTGVVALLLQKDKTLDFVAVRDALRNNVRPVPGGSVDEWGTGKLDAQLAMASIAAPPPGPVVPSAGGGGGGGGGGGIAFARLLTPADHGPVLPLAAAWPRYVPTPYRIGEIEHALSATPAGHLAMALISRHVDEVARIVNEKRRVATIWHRMRGPELLRVAVGWRGDAEPPIPASFAGHRVTERLARLLRILERYASPPLLQDIRTYRDFALALPGASLATLTTVPPPEH